jgi:AcrR family transcriptional regulator
MTWFLFNGFAGKSGKTLQTYRIFIFDGAMARIRNQKNRTKKEIIIEKASLLFREKGFGATSMRDLAEEVGVEAASLYNHIQSKSDILQAICFRVANDFLSNLQAVETNDDPVLAKMETILRFHIKMMMEQFAFVYISDHEWRHLPEPYLSNFLNQRRNYRRSLSEMIAKGIAKKEIREMDPYVAVLTMLSAIGGIESWHRSGKAVSAGVVGDEMVGLLIRGLRA